jgi:MFS family permease
MRSPDIPAWWPRRWYYGWALVITLGVTATVSYGILSYAFAVFITPMGEELGWSKTQITGAFSISQLVLGVSAIPLGRWVDRWGARTLMTAGSIVATLLLLAWSGVQTLEAFYAIWAVMGVALAAVLYEPAFAVVATWFRRGRGRALTLLTFIGGFASVIFVPLTTELVSRLGWRTALVWLAVIYAMLTVIPHAVVLRRWPADVGLVPDGDAALGSDVPSGKSRSRSPRSARPSSRSTSCRSCSSGDSPWRSPAVRWASWVSWPSPAGSSSPHSATGGRGPPSRRRSSCCKSPRSLPSW